MDGEKATDGGLERGSHPLFAAVIAVGEGDIMAITGISYGRTFVYETQKRVNEGVLQSTSDAENRFAENLEAAEENDKALAPVTRGVRLNRRIEGKDKVPYGEMAEDGVIEYNGVVFVCDYDHNRLTLGDTSNEKDCINIPLSGGGSLLVNRNNIDALSKAIGMFSPEDVNRILRALAQDKKIREMEKELDDMENGDNVDSNEETSETPDADKAAETDPAGTAGESEKEDLSLMEQIREKMQEIYDKLQNGDTDTKFQIGNQEFTIKEWDHFLEKFDSVQDATRAALEEKIEKEKVERLEEKLTGMSETAEEPDEVDSILAQSVKTTEEGSDPKTWYITCFSEDGIWCKKFTEGQEGEDLWRMEFTDPSQYQKVLNYLQSFAEGEEVPHAEEEDFWRRFLEEDAR